MRYFMQLSYCGANYHGWQVQPHDVSVQQVVEHALATLLRTPTPITGAGRTDTGVNARMMIAHFDTTTPITDTAGTIRQLNGILPADIAVQSVRPVADDSHARFDATSRTYKYFVHTVKSPFLNRSSWRTVHALDYDLMNESAATLMKHRDFTSFSKLHTDVKTNNCIVSFARWERLNEEQWVFTITADRFLRNMVRAVVGTLIEVGRHRMTVNEFENIIDARDRCLAGTSMPAHALYLWDITYPY